MKKTASLHMSLQQWQYGPVYLITGDAFNDTYSIKDKLMSYGFKWSKFGKGWFISQKAFDSFPQPKKDEINQLINGQKPQSSPNVSNPTPPNPTQPKTVEKKDDLILHGEPANITDKKELSVSKRYSFPIENNIYSYPITLDVDGEPYEVMVEFDRSFKKGVTSTHYHPTFNAEYRDYPIYVCRIGKREKTNSPIIEKRLSNKKSGKPYGTYNEKEMLDELKDKLKPLVEKTSSYINLIKDKKSEELRDEELKSFLEKIKETNKKHLEYSIVIDNNELYNGTYSVNVQYHNSNESYSNTSYDSWSSYFYNEVRGTPYVDHPDAPSYVLTSGQLFSLPLVGIVTKEQLDSKINEILKTEEVKNKYIAYLESFPFVDASKKEGFEDFEIIASIINKPYDYVNMVGDKLKSMGYVRQNLKSTDKLIPDSKKIVNDVYTRQKKDPNYFYTLVAYQLHYFYRGLHMKSFSQSVLMFDVYSLLNVLKKFGNISHNDVLRAISILGDECYAKFFGKRGKNTWENWSEFYSGSTGSGSTGGGSIQSVDSSDIALNDLQGMAEENGIVVGDIKSEAKNVWRQLSKKFHPDLNIGNVDAEENMKTLNLIWEKVDQKHKFSKNWYREFIKTGN